MSVNPVAGGGLPPDLATIIAKELASLASDAQTLQARLVSGDVVCARVLPSNGLTDLLEIGGLRVAAELPPTLVPGETITVAVTSFTGDRINLQILPPAAPAATATIVGAAETIAIATPGRTAETFASSTTGRTAETLIATPGRTTETLIAPPVAAADAIADASPVAPQSRVLAVLSPPVADVDRSAPVVPIRAARPLPTELGSIEARLATAHATIAPLLMPRSTVAPGGTVAPGAGPVAPGAAPRPSSVAARPPIVPRAVSSPTAPELARGNVPDPAKSTVSTATPPGPVVPHAPTAYNGPSALLRALGLPRSPTNIAAAQLALQSPDKLPQALGNLERALASTTDPNVATLRTLTGFLARIEPQSPVLAAQVAAFVDQVVIGREGKLAALLEAHVQSAASRVSEAPDPIAGPAAGRVAIRQAALDYDLKTQLLAVVTASRDEAVSATPKSQLLAAAVGSALTAVTALQINAATTLAANPDGLAFVVPIALPSGFAAAHVRINRDAPQTKGAALDGDNFHIGFILETQHLGTVAIDLRTVGRSVTLNVQTEAVLAQLAFGAALTDLTQRLETLRYHVAKADAVVAPRGIALPPTVPVAAEPVAKPADRPRLVDLDA